MSLGNYTGTTIQEDLGYVRDCTNPETGITYVIKITKS